MVDVKLVSEKPEEIRLINKLNRVGEVELGRSYNLKVLYNPDNRHCIGYFSYRLRDKRSEGLELELSVNMVASFEHEFCDSEEKKNEIHRQAYELMFSHMQEYIKSVAECCGFHNLIIRKEPLGDVQVIQPNTP